MTRYVQPVDDELIMVEVPVIEDVALSNTEVLTSEYKDPFSVTNDEIKAFDGLDQNSRRRVTTQINKVYQGSDGKTGTKQLEGKDVLTAYDAFGVVMPPHNLDYLAKLYIMSSPHKAAVDAKTANIVGLGYKFVESRKTKRTLEDNADNVKKKQKLIRALEIHKDDLLDQIESYNQEDGFIEILIKVWKDYETTGNGYLEIGRKRDGSIGYIGHIPSTTMRVRRKRDGFVQVSANKVQFFRNFGDTKTSSPIRSEDTPNEVIHIKKHSPTHSYYGIPDIMSAQQAVAGNEFAQRFNLDYFENKAVPRYVITIKGAKLGTRAQAELLQFFESVKGTNHRTIIIPLPPGDGENDVEFNMEAVETGNQDSSFNNYRKANLMDILMVHRVPITKISVGEGVNLAVARDADKTFKEQVCAPEQKVLEKKLNKIFKELTDAFELKLNEMTLTDEDTQSKIDERNKKAGLETSNEIRARKGQPAIEGGDELVDLNAKDKIAQQQAEMNAQRQRDSVRSAEATDSAGEGRSPKGDGRTTP